MRMGEDILHVIEEQLAEGPWDQQNTVSFGEFMKSRAIERSLPIAISIFFDGQRIYQVGLPGTSSANDEWITRKVNTVNLTRHSSLALRGRIDALGIQEGQLGFNSGHLAVCGGGFPLYLDGQLVGIAIISGLPHEDDHEFLVESLTEFKRGLKW